MKIVVLVKHVPDATGERSFAADGTVDRASSDGLLSELDEYAVEQALQIADDQRRRRGRHHEPWTSGCGRRDQARAADGRFGRDPHHDDAVHGSDALASSLLLAEAIKKAAPDLVICGMASTDGTMGVIPAMIAERLGGPLRRSEPPCRWPKTASPSAAIPMWRA